MAKIIKNGIMKTNLHQTYILNTVDRLNNRNLRQRKIIDAIDRMDRMHVVKLEYTESCIKDAL